MAAEADQQLETGLPEYYPTRTETALLQSLAGKIAESLLNHPWSGAGGFQFLAERV